MIKLEKPTLCYRSYDALIKGHVLNRKHKYPCVSCHGKGWIYDPNDTPCPIEGNKMRNRIKCYKCNGSGEGTKDDWKPILADYREDYKQKMIRYKEAKRLLASINKKLNQEEKNFLKKYLSHRNF